MRSKKKAAAKSGKRAKKQNSAAKKTPKVRAAKKPRITVLIADDQSVVREGVVSLISRKADMAAIGRAATGREAGDCWRQHRPSATLAEPRRPRRQWSDAIHGRRTA